MLRQTNLRQIDLSQISLHAEYVLPCAGFLALGVFTRALRWRALLGGMLSVGQSFSIVSATYLVNSLLPLRAGEPVRAYMAAQSDPPVPVMRAASTIILERILDTLAIALLVSGVLILTPTAAESIRAVASLAAPAAILVLVTLILVVRFRDHVERLLRSGGTRLGISPRLLDQAIHFLDGLQLLAQVRTLLVGLVLTGIGWAMTVSAGYTLLIAVFGVGNWVTASLFVGAIAFAVAIPAVPGNLGTFELSVLLVLQATGYPDRGGAPLAFAILLHTIDLAVYFVCGITGLFHLGISLTRVVSLLRETPQNKPG